jgi:type IV secretion system protein TrbC
MMVSKKNLLLFAAASALFVLVAPDAAFASGIDEFSDPIEQVMETITGPVGKWISIIMMAVCGIVYWVRKEDIEGGFKLMLGAVFAISFIAFASDIVSGLFEFSSGALI